MTKDLVVHEQRPYELTEKQVTIIANTEFVPQDKRGKLDVIWASIFKGRSIGIDDFTAINEIHIVNGKPGLSAALAAGIARKRGHVIDGTMSATGATAHGRRADNGAEMTVTFTIEDAKNAGLAGKQVWKQYAQSMLWARAVTQLCRALFSDCFVGGVYTPEELGADYVVDDDVIDDPPPPDRVLLDVPETEIKLGQAEADEQTHLEDAPPEQDDTGEPGGYLPWPQLVRLAQASGVYDQLLATAKERFPGRTSKSLSDNECAELWKTVEPVNA